MLEVRGLVKRYASCIAVQDVSFALERGEILGYLGPNGAGKSTTVKILVGLIEPTGGQVLFDGASILDDIAGFQRRIGYVPEEPNLYPHLSGREYLQLAGRLRGIARRPLEPKIDKFLRLFALLDDAYAPVTSYSKGMRQKILLSAALLHNPDVLILDEPMSGLDAPAILMMRELLRQLAAQGKMILFSSHVMDFVERICSRVVILNKGRVAADDSIERLRELMHAPSLEQVFAELTQSTDVASVAGGIIEAMRS